MYSEELQAEECEQLVVGYCGNFEIIGFHILQSEPILFRPAICLAAKKRQIDRRQYSLPSNKCYQYPIRTPISKNQRHLIVHFFNLADVILMDPVPPVRFIFNLLILYTRNHIQVHLFSSQQCQKKVLRYIKHQRHLVGYAKGLSASRETFCLSGLLLT